MVIKLIPTDSVNPCKIQLPLGEHVIGRGKLLECDDKRISRQHGKLEVCDDSLCIKALHKNPCFYTKKGSTNVEILKQDESANLYNGDRFGLLPDAFWYEVLYCLELDSPSNCDMERNTEEYCIENNDPVIETTSDEIKTSDYNLNEGAVSPSLIAPENQDPVQEINNSTVEQSSINNIETTKQNENDDNELDKHDESDVLNDPNEQNISKHSEQIDTEEQNEMWKHNEAVKRSHSSDNFGVKKIKTEPCEMDTEPAAIKTESDGIKTDSDRTKTESDEIKTETKEIKTKSDEVKNENDVKPGPSLDQGQAPAVQPVNDGAPSANNGAPNNNKPLRERCMYGANCYSDNLESESDQHHAKKAMSHCDTLTLSNSCQKRNPQHLTQFSHPRDNDWGPGQRGQCPYGASCAKTDPRHWRDHEHPPGKLPPARPGQRRKRQKRARSDSPNRNVIVAGKRVRKLVPRRDWSDEDSDEPDPFGTDESDEWEPDSLDPSQDYSEEYL